MRECWDCRFCRYDTGRGKYWCRNHDKPVKRHDDHCGDAETEAAQFRVETWFERDRSMVALSHGDEEVVTWWDEAVQELVEDGFLNPRDWLGSAVEYAKYVELI